MTDKQDKPYQAAALCFTLAAYFVGAPTLSLILGSWVPMLLGIAAVFAVVLALLGINMVRDAKQSDR